MCLSLKNPTSLSALDCVFFFSVGIGKLIVEDESIFCLTMTSPLGNFLKGKSAGDTVQFNGNAISILDVS